MSNFIQNHGDVNDAWWDDFAILLKGCMFCGPDQKSGNYNNSLKIKEVLGRFPYKHIYLFCMPKSGSSFLTATIRELTGFKVVYSKYSVAGQNENLYLPNMLLTLNTNSFDKNHMHATDANMGLIDLFSIHPIILVRNIFDVLISYYDHLNMDRVKKTASYSGQANMAFLNFINERYYDLSDETKLDMLVDMAAPWDIKFYVSWYDKTIARGGDSLWITYEEFISNKIETVQKMLEIYKIEKSNTEIMAVLRMIDKNKEKTTGFNKGVSGRGKKILSDEQRNRIVKMTQYYPWVDFARIGL